MACCLGTIYLPYVWSRNIYTFVYQQFTYRCTGSTCFTSDYVWAVAIIIVILTTMANNQELRHSCVAVRSTCVASSYPQTQVNFVILSDEFEIIFQIEVVFSFASCLLCHRLNEIATCNVIYTYKQCFTQIIIFTKIIQTSSLTAIKFLLPNMYFITLRKFRK